MPNVLPGARIMPRGTNGAGPLNSWLDFPLYERCITRGIGGSVLRVIYGNGNQIVQGPGVVAFSYEMLPDTRIFHMDGRPHVNQKIGMYLGDSRARWEGEELVVETTNLTDQTAFGVNGLGTQHSKAMKITERFRRVADDIIQYQATWDDPLTYLAPFTVSFPLTPLDGGVLLPYECHSGNKAIEMSLAAERDEDRTMAEAAAKGIKRERRAINQEGGVQGPDAGRAGAAGGRGGRGGGSGYRRRSGEVTTPNSQLPTPNALFRTFGIWALVVGSLFSRLFTHRLHNPAPAFSGQTKAPAPSKPSAPVNVQTIATGLTGAWAVAFLPDGNFLVTQNAGTMRVVRPDGVVLGPVAGVPGVKAVAAQGLHDVVLDPEFARTGRSTSPTSRRRRARRPARGRSSSSTSACGRGRSSSAGRWISAPSGWRGRVSAPTT